MKTLFLRLALLLALIPSSVFANQGGSSQGSGGTGNVNGPGSSTNNAIVRWNGAAGTQLLNSVVIVDNAGATSGITTLSIAGPLSHSVSTAPLEFYGGVGTAGVHLRLGGTSGTEANTAATDATTHIIRSLDGLTEFSRMSVGGLRFSNNAGLLFNSDENQSISVVGGATVSTGAALILYGDNSGSIIDSRSDQFSMNSRTGGDLLFQFTELTATEAATTHIRRASGGPAGGTIFETLTSSGLQLHQADVFRDTADTAIKIWGTNTGDLTPAFVEIDGSTAINTYRNNTHQFRNAASTTLQTLSSSGLQLGVQDVFRGSAGSILNLCSSNTCGDAEPRISIDGGADLIAVRGNTVYVTSQAVSPVTFSQLDSTQLQLYVNVIARNTTGSNLTIYGGTNGSASPFLFLDDATDTTELRGNSIFFKNVAGTLQATLTTSLLTMTTPAIVRDAAGGQLLVSGSNSTTTGPIVILSDATDTTEYWATTHSFENLTGGATFATLTSSQLTMTTPKIARNTSGSNLRIWGGDGVVDDSPSLFLDDSTDKAALVGTTVTAESNGGSVITTTSGTGFQLHIGEIFRNVNTGSLRVSGGGQGNGGRTTYYGSTATPARTIIHNGDTQNFQTDAAEEILVLTDDLLEMASDAAISFSNTTTPSTGTADIGLIRAAADIAEFTDGALTGVGSVRAANFYSAPVDKGNQSGASPTVTMSLNDGRIQVVDLDTATGTVTLQLDGEITGAEYIIRITQGASTPTVAFSGGTFVWANASTYVATATNNAVDIVTCAYIGTVFYCSWGGNYQ